MKMFLGCLLFMCSVNMGCAQTPPSIDMRNSMPAAVQFQADLDAKTILQRAYENAGGDNFVRPKTLLLTGYNIIRKDGGEVIWDDYSIWREFDNEKTDAHQANGKVRIEGRSENKIQLLLSFDGEHTYNQNGKMEDQSANAMWSNNFGFGAIRHALDDGWVQDRKVDRLIDGAPTFMIELADPSGKQTLFGIRQDDYAIVYVGFQTPRGWHERRYSHFFEKPDINWRQAGRVRLFYNGEKANEAIWTDFEVNTKFAEEIFTVED